MKILLVHPNDSAQDGPWAGTQWDLVVDLGWSGRFWYAQQSERLGCRILSIFDLLDHEQHRCQLRDLLELESRLIDSESINWWEVFSAFHYQQLEQLLLVSALAEQIPDSAEIFATRPHFYMRALALQRKREIRTFLPEPRAGITSNVRRYLRASLALRPPQLVDVAFDKWDPTYQFRRLLGRRPPSLTTPVVLLPSAYVNVSRAQMAYAQMLPHRQFMLVVTRTSGRRLKLSPNVALRSLASYAPRPSSSTDAEGAHLLTAWQTMQSEIIARHHILSFASRLQMFDGFRTFLRVGLSIRDAWRNVIGQEPIAAVLSADENNPFTRLPVLLARSRGLRTIFCDHGALNLTFGIRQACSDTYVAGGEMARDYLVQWCHLAPEKIVVGGPQTARHSPPSSTTRRDWIVFFSEEYELSAARTEVLYAELLPELCALARKTDRKVIIKLHPFESLRIRRALVGKTVSADDRALLEIREGPMTPDLLHRAWFSVVVESSVAVESTTNGVPCFLCSWFDGSWYDYGKQFAKYSAGYPLDSPQSIRQIPQLLERIEITDAIRQRLHSSMSPEQLDSVLFGVSPRAVTE